MCVEVYGVIERKRDVYSAKDERERGRDGCRCVWCNGERKGDAIERECDVCKYVWCYREKERCV